MKLGFHSEQLGIRGTEVALYDYAKYNIEILNNESIILYPLQSKNNDYSIESKFSKEFKIYGYNNQNDINRICDIENLDAVYYIKSGINDGKNSNRKNLIHAVFQSYDPHGDRYTYISEWLSNHISNIINKPTTYVPHIVQLPKPNDCYRKKLNIQKNALVIGRYGGFDQFDISFVQEAIIKYVIKNTNCYFIFVNTNKFIDHPRILFLPKISDLQEKSNFINTCDAMIHGRSDGESFGLAICEFLYGNKPVLAWNGGTDGNHRVILDGTNLLYNNLEDLLIKFDLLAQGDYSNIEYNKLVSNFTPEIVMKKFKNIFLDNL
jgi:hypothetical protein